jgi:hypothetical protein
MLEFMTVILIAAEADAIGNKHVPSVAKANIVIRQDSIAVFPVVNGASETDSLIGPSD